MYTHMTGATWNDFVIPSKIIVCQFSTVCQPKQLNFITIDKISNKENILVIQSLYCTIGTIVVLLATWPTITHEYIAVTLSLG